MKAIRTRYHGPTNTRGSRYSATDCDGNRIIIGARDSISSTSNHKRAAMRLADKLDWKGIYYGAWLGRDMVWIRTKSLDETTFIVGDCIA